VGDEVFSNDPVTKKKGYRRVERLFTHQASDLEVVRLSDGTSFACTPSHRIWVINHGWISAGSLQIGEKLLLQNQRNITISGLDPRHRETTVYNFEVADLHTYYVGKDSILVHNDCGGGPMTEDQVALKDLVNETTNKGRVPLSRENTETVMGWAKEYNYPGFRAGPNDLAKPSNWDARPVPHIHLRGAGRSGHVEVDW
jgi:hypothetical protein